MLQIISKNDFEFILLLRWKSLLIRLFSLKNDLPRWKLTKIATCCRTYSVLYISFCIIFSNITIIFILKLSNRRRRLFFDLLNLFMIVWRLCHRIKINLFKIIWYLVISYFLNNLRGSESFKFVSNVLCRQVLLE